MQQTEERRVEPRFLDLRAASSYLSIPENTLRDFVKTKRIPFIRKARRLKFDRRRLDAWMLEDAHEPQATD